MERVFKFVIDKDVVCDEFVTVREEHDGSKAKAHKCKVNAHKPSRYAPTAHHKTITNPVKTEGTRMKNKQEYEGVPKKTESTVTWPLPPFFLDVESFAGKRHYIRYCTDTPTENKKEVTV